MTIEEQIKEDKQIRKFSWYGFLKNLKFFEPYLLLYFLNDGMTLLSVGSLFAIREATTYIFEVPSGIIADFYGKKKELMICFIFYIISFMLLFVGKSYTLFMIAMFFYGLGEAFRSGTHKAMILSYLEQMGWQEYKTKVYGRTRSFSLIGSSISAIVAIFLALYLPSLRLIFVFSVIPFLLDFILISSYPESLNEATHQVPNLSGFIKTAKVSVKNIFGQKELRKVLISSAIFTGLFKTIQHYIQPIIKGVIMATGLVVMLNLSTDEAVKIILGILYGIFNLVSAFSSKNLYKLVKDHEANKRFDQLLIVMVMMLVTVSIGLRFESISIVIFGFFVMYLIKDVRRPLFLVSASHYMNKNERATALSIESQISALSMMILSPACGFIADKYGMTILFVALAFVILLLGLFTRIPSSEV